MHPKVAIHTPAGVIVRTDMDNGMYPEDGHPVEGDRIVHRIWDFEQFHQNQMYMLHGKMMNGYGTWNIFVTKYDLFVTKNWLRLIGCWLLILH